MEGMCLGSSGESLGSARSASSSDRSHSPSSATSPSSQGTLPYRRTSASGSTALSSEALTFLSDLDNYLALGCLCFEDSTDQDDDLDSEIWRDVNQLPPIIAFDETLYAHLQKLAAAYWIRITSKRSSDDPCFLIFRIYILPFDVGRRFVNRHSTKLHPALQCLVTEIDISEDTWQGRFSPEKVVKFDPWATKDEGSLFWMFNKLPSPKPCVDLVKEKYSREALEDLLDPGSVLPGLNTPLYPYQRRSAGLMLQRESISTRHLDPRFERRVAPDGAIFYFGARGLEFCREADYYDACKGGILAETMGLGKTVICLALILATKDHPPIVPTEHIETPKRSSVPCLAELAISTINRKSVPWRVELARIKHATGDEMESCRQRLERTPASYQIKVQQTRFNRKSVEPPPKTMTLASTTVIVVPRNLCKQWQSEIRKHIDADTLRVLVMEDTKKPLPLADELRTYDIILFTRGRFELEIKDGADAQGRRLGTTQRLCRCPYIGATRTRDCHCLSTDDLYDSPLKHLHFKRLIIDEGHFFSNTNAAAVSVANKLITADHRWVVSGTPAKDLLGVEVDMSAAENLWHTPDTKDSRDAVLEQRRFFSKKDDTVGAIKSLGSLASNFLKIEPWSVSGNEKADWEEHVYRHEDLRKKTYSGFSSSLRGTLARMVVKTQPEDVEKDINLPPLSHEVIRLEPSFYDKLTANLFTLVLTANAITSERTDVDYLFHKNSQKARSQLISNLRQSAFFWTGFSEADVRASLKSSNGYLSKEGTGCTESDRKLLVETLACADAILESEGWKSLSRSHELGLFVDHWPDESAEHWAFDESRSPLMTGLSQLLDAQKHVNGRIGEEDPGEGLSGAGIRALAPARYGTAKVEESDKQKMEKPILTKGIPTSSLDGEPLLRRRLSLTGKGSSPRKSAKPSKIVKPQKKQTQQKRQSVVAKSDKVLKVDKNVYEAANAVPQNMAEVNLPSDSPFLQSQIVGTSSAKMSYLIAQVLKHYREEKILIFYDGDNVAYYIAQMLELLHIKHEIYAKSLPAYLKAQYVVRFDQEVADRVLLMDVRNAAFGLNLSSASRIFFVNPVCRPNIEAQAIKRAHRIGQTRKVFVETLVLKDTIEDKMLERSKRMTRSEHHDAKALEDDGGIREIIQSAKVLPIYENEKSGYGQMAALEESQQLWNRLGWKEFTGHNASKSPSKSDTGSKKRKLKVEDLDEGNEAGEDGSGRKVRRVLDFVDCTNEDSEDEPILSQWRRRSSMTLSSQCDSVTKTEPSYFNPDSIESLGKEASDQQDRRLSISHLMNAEQPAEPIPMASPELLQAILKRL